MADIEEQAKAVGDVIAAARDVVAGGERADILAGALDRYDAYIAKQKVGRVTPPWPTLMTKGG